MPTLILMSVLIASDAPLREPALAEVSLSELKCVRTRIVATRALAWATPAVGMASGAVAVGVGLVAGVRVDSGWNLTGASRPTTVRWHERYVAPQWLVGGAVAVGTSLVLFVAAAVYQRLTSAENEAVAAEIERRQEESAATTR